MAQKKRLPDKKQKLWSLSPINNLGMEDHSFASCKEYLDDAFENQDIHNLALSGNFGAGKSSILHSFDRNRNYGAEKFLYVSLTDFQNYGCNCETKNVNTRENSNNEKTITEQEDGDKKANDNSTQKRVEFSMLCQILSRCRKKNLRDSSLSGIPEAAITVAGMLFSALFVVLIFILVFHERFAYLAGRIGVPATWRADIHAWMYVAVACLLCFLVCHVLRNGKVKKISVKSAYAETEMELLKSSASLDLYKFELIHTIIDLAPSIDHTVVFEDMDRLDSTICIAVITKLRDLNVMINTRRKTALSKDARIQLWIWECFEKNRFLSWGKRIIGRVLPRWIKQWFGNHYPYLARGTAHIRFVYAVGENVLNHQLRSKFYDCIIPVTPALNQFNAEDVLCKLLVDNGVDITREHTWKNIKEIIPFLSDYRTVRTMCNELRILRSQFLGGVADIDINCAQMLALAFYKVMVPQMYSRAFDEDGFGELPEVSATDFPELKDQEYCDRLAKQLNRIRPDKEMLQLMFLSRQNLCSRWIRAIQDGPQERAYDALREMNNNRLINITEELKNSNIFESSVDSGIITSVASYIFQGETGEDSFDEWFYKAGKCSEHKFTNCMIFLTATGQIEITTVIPAINPTELFKWCIDSLPSLRNDTGHEARWNKEMTGLLETILSTNPTAIPDNLLDIQITENQTLEDLVSIDLNELDEEASGAVLAEIEMLKIINDFRVSNNQEPKRHVSRNEFVDFCKTVFTSTDSEAKAELAEDIAQTNSLDISSELIDWKAVEKSDNQEVAYYLIKHMYKNLGQGIFIDWFFKISEPQCEKFAKCLYWAALKSDYFVPEQLLDWCLENLAVLQNISELQVCWCYDNAWLLREVLKLSPEQVLDKMKTIVLYDGISVGDLLNNDDPFAEEDDTAEESFEQSHTELLGPEPVG